jgi:hypothetical protein
MKDDRKWWWQAFAESDTRVAYSDAQYWVGKITKCIEPLRSGVDELSTQMAWSILAASLTHGPAAARPYAEQVIAMPAPDARTERVIRFLIDAEIHRPTAKVETIYGARALVTVSTRSEASTAYRALTDHS